MMFKLQTRRLTIQLIKKHKSTYQEVSTFFVSMFTLSLQCVYDKRVVNIGFQGGVVYNLFNIDCHSCQPQKSSSLIDLLFIDSTILN